MSPPLLPIAAKASPALLSNIRILTAPVGRHFQCTHDAKVFTVLLKLTFILVGPIGLATRYDVFRAPSPEAVSDFNTAHALDLREAFPVRAVQSAMVRKHPLLRQWGTLGHSWGTLMFLESQAMLGTMLELMDDHGIPSLSVHDSIIVRARDEEIARGVLSKHYEGACGLKPFLAVSRAS